MKEYNPKNINEAIDALDEHLSDKEKEFIMTHLGEDIGYIDSMKLSLIAANITNSWIKERSLSNAIPNYSQPNLFNYGDAILKIYKRHLLGKDLHTVEILLKVNWMDYERYNKESTNK